MVKNRRLHALKPERLCDANAIWERRRALFVQWVLAQLGLPLTL
ncbi:hypothetical protein [Dulcicalothrix desertica]|nr:hypothetical protein [Dulcicalothrix desertica]